MSDTAQKDRTEAIVNNDTSDQKKRNNKWKRRCKKLSKKNSHLNIRLMMRTLECEMLKGLVVELRKDLDSKNKSSKTDPELQAHEVDLRDCYDENGEISHDAIMDKIRKSSTQDSRSGVTEGSKEDTIDVSTLIDEDGQLDVDALLSRLCDVALRRALMRHGRMRLRYWTKEGDDDDQKDIAVLLSLDDVGISIVRVTFLRHENNNKTVVMADATDGKNIDKLINELSSKGYVEHEHSSATRH